MKTNYKVPDKVRITKPGNFDQLEGSVSAIHTDKRFKPLVVDLGPCGIWSFNYDDVEPMKKEAPATYAFDKQPAAQVKAAKKKDNTKVKRPYTKRK